MLYDDVFRELAVRRVRYLGVGGIALNLHGYARLTMDMDLINMKTISGRPRDMEDVEHLRKISSGGGTAR